MNARAAILRPEATTFELADIDIGPLRPDEVLVRIVAAGICHTDLAMLDRPNIPRPIVLGHEGAGVVEAVGDAAQALKHGDHVVLSFDFCGECKLCLSGHPAYCRQARPLNFGGRRSDGSSALSEDGEPVNGHFFGQSSFATYAVARERCAVKVDPALPLDVLAPLGCGLQTGAGAVLNVLKPAVGSSIAVFGTGSVGLSALMAAVASGCSTVIAIDLNTVRLDAARSFGATHCINPNDGPVPEQVRAVLPDGLDFAFSTTGRPESLRDAVESLDFGGTAAFVASGGDASIPTPTLLWGRSLRGIVQGDSQPQTFIRRLIEMWQQGLMPFDRLITRYPFDQINDAAQASLNGTAIKPVLLMDS